LNWSSIIKLALTTGLFTAVLNQGFAWLREEMKVRRRQTRTSKALALKLVGMLTAYAQECNSRIDANLYDQREGEVGRHSDLPDLPPFPSGPELLPIKIAVGLQDLRNEVVEARRAIEGTLEVDGPPEATDTTVFQLTAVGYTAFRLATRLRRHYGFGRYQAAGSSDFASDLRKRYRKVHRGPLRGIWHNLPVYKVRRRVSRWRQRFVRYLPQKD
jgi:hypothetical protein